MENEARLLTRVVSPSHDARGLSGRDSGQSFIRAQAAMTAGPGGCGSGLDKTQRL